MKTTFCNCNNYCLDTKCASSDSGLQVRKCWCVECKVTRKEIKQRAYTIILPVGA